MTYVWYENDHLDALSSNYKSIDEHTARIDFSMFKLLANEMEALFRDLVSFKFAKKENY